MAFRISKLMTSELARIQVYIHAPNHHFHPKISTITFFPRLKILVFELFLSLLSESISARHWGFFVKCPHLLFLRRLSAINAQTCWHTKLLMAIVVDTQISLLLLNNSLIH